MLSEQFFDQVVLHMMWRGDVTATLFPLYVCSQPRNDWTYCWGFIAHC